MTLQSLLMIRFEHIRERNQALPIILELVILKLDLNQPFISPDVLETITVEFIYDFEPYLISGECDEYSLENTQVRLNAWKLVISGTVLTSEPVTAGPKLLSDFGMSCQHAVDSQ